MEGSQTLAGVKDLLAARNKFPYFVDNVLENDYETQIEILTEMWGAGTLGTEHPNWDTGNREGFAILAFDKPSLIYKLGNTVQSRSSAIHYIESEKKYITCPELYFGPDTYTLVSSHRGLAGLLIKAMMDALNYFVPGQWTRDNTTGNLSINGKHFFSWISDYFATDLSSYALEITTFSAWHDHALYVDAYRGDNAYLSNETDGLLNLAPDIVLKDFFEYLFDNITRFY